MKLHLPKGLRKALSVCLATLALPTVVSTTVCTASGIVAVWVIASQQAYAEYPTITSTDEYKAAAGDTTKNAEGQTWEINVDDTVENYSFWFQGAPGSAGNWSSVTKADLHFMRTLTVGFNGSSDRTQTFYGALTGEAGANLVFNWTGHTNTWQFNGSLAGFAGDISAKAGTINVVFGEGAQSNTGAIKQDGGTLNLTLNGQTMNNSEISVNNLTINGAVSFKEGLQVTAGTSTLNSGASLTLGANSNVNLGTLAANSTLTSLTLAGGSTLTLGIGADGVLSFDNVTGDGSLIIDVSALGSINNYQLFAADKVGWLAGWKENIRFTVAGVTLSDNGTISRRIGDVDYGEAEAYTSEVTMSGDTPKWYSGVPTGAVFTVNGGQSAESSSGDLKLSNTYRTGAEPDIVLNLNGAINSLYFTHDTGANKGAFHFGDGTGNAWTMGEGVSIKDIYIDGAELFLQCETDFGSANVHVIGLTGGNNYEGTIRAHSHKVTIGGNLVVEGDALISVQNGQIEVGGQLTGTGNLIIGTYGGGTVTLKQGGDLEGGLTFLINNYGNGVVKLVLEKGTGEEASNNLSVYGLSSESDQPANTHGGVVVAGGEGQGTATLVLTGAGEYTYRGTLGTEAEPDVDGQWADSSALSVEVGMQENGQQILNGNAHLKDLTVSGGKLTSAAALQVDGTLRLSGGTTEINRTALVKNMEASGGNLTLGEGARLVLDAITGTITLGTLEWSGEATIDLRGMLKDLRLAATALQPGGVLHIILSEEFLRSISEGSGEYQLFTSEIWNDTHVRAEGNGYRIKCDDNGVITVAEAIPYSWEVKAEASTFTWDAEIGDVTTPWTEGSGAADGCPVTMTNEVAEGGAVVTLIGPVQAGSVTFNGKYGFTLTASDGNSSLTTGGGLIVNTTLLCKAAVHVGGTITGTGNIQIGEYEPDSETEVSGSINVDGEDDVDIGGWLSVVAGSSFSALKAHVRLGGGLTSDQLAVDVDPEYMHDWGGTVNVKSLETNVEKGDVAYEGTLTVTGALTKTGAGKQTIYGSGLTVGSVDVQGGTLHIGGPQYETNEEHRPDLSTGSISVSGGSFEWQAGVLTVTGKTAITGEGAAMHVLTGDLDIRSGGTAGVIEVNGIGASLTVTGSIVTQGGDGGSINVRGGGSLTAASLSGTNNGNVGYFGHGHAPILNVGEESNGTITTGTVTIGSEQAGDALLQVKHLTVIGEGSSVTVWGDLSSSYGDGSTIKDGTVKVSGNMVQQGALTIDGGTLELGGYYANASNNTTANGGNITISRGGSMSIGGGLHVGDITLNGTTDRQSRLVLTAAKEVTANTVTNLTLGDNSGAEIGEKQSLSVTGTLTMGTNTTLTLGRGTGTLTVGTLVLNGQSGGASLILEMTAVGSNLDIGNMQRGEGEEGKLTIELKGYKEWVAEHPEGKYQLFNAEHFGTLSDGLGGDPDDWFRFIVDVDERMKCTLGTDGVLTIEPDEGIYWNGGDGGVWSEGGSGWEGGEVPGTDSYVTFDEKAQGEVKIAGAVEVDGVQVLSGTYTFASNTPGGGTDSLKANELFIRSGAMLNVGVELKAGGSGEMAVVLEGGLDVKEGAVLGEGVKIQFNGGVLKYTGESAAEDIVSNRVDAEGSLENVKIEVAKEQDRTWGVNKKTSGNDVTTTPENNEGLKLALDGNKDGKGLEKSGEGNFTLAWEETGGEAHVGKMEVKGGKLTLDVVATNPAVMAGGVTVAGGAVLEVKASGGRLSIGGIEGDGTLELSQGYITLTGSNTVSSVDLAVDSNVTVDSDEALSCATLTLSGGDLVSNDTGHTIKAGTVNVEAPTSITGNLNLTGTVAGSGTLIAEPEAKITLTGRVTDFVGTLDTGKGTIALGMPGEVKAAVVGNGILAAQGNGEIVLTGELTKGTFTLQSAGNGTLVVASPEISSDVKADTGTAGGSIVLGYYGGESGQVVWNNRDRVQGNGYLVLANVKLSDGNSFKKGSTHILVETAAESEIMPTAHGTYAGGIVDVSGMDAGQIDGISVNKGGVLKGLIGEYKVTKERGLYLYFDPTNWGDAAAREAGNLNALIEGNDITLDLGSGEGTVFEFDDGTIYKCFKSDRETDLYLRVAEGGSIVNAPALSQWKSWLPGLVQKVQYTEDGYVILTGRTDDIYVVANDGRDSEVSEKPGLLASKKATVVLDGKTLTLNWKGGTSAETAVHNLLGTAGTGLHVNNTANNPTGNRLSLRLDNTLAEDIHDAMYNPDSLPKPEGATARGQDTTFLGEIVAGNGVDINKEGRGTLTVGGNYTLADGTTTLSGGALVLRGKENSSVNLAFAYATEQDTDTETQRGLILDGGETTIKGEISDTEGKGGGNAVYFRNGAKLVLQGTSKLNNTSFIGESTGGTIMLEGTGEKGAELSLGSGALSGVEVQFNENSTLDIGSGASSVTTLSGNGVLKSKAGSTLSVDNGQISGHLDSSDGVAAGKLIVRQNLVLDNVTTGAGSPAQGWGIQVNEGSEITIDVSKKGKDDRMVFGEVDFGNGSKTTIKLNSDTYNAEEQSGNDTITGTSFNAGEGTVFVLDAVEGGDWDTYRSLTLGKYNEVKGLPDPSDIKLKGNAFVLLEVKEVKAEADGSVKLVLDDSQVNPFVQSVLHGEKNAKAGAVMLGESLRHKIQASSRTEVMASGDYASLVKGLLAMVESNAPGLQHAYAALGGASISTLGPALTEDVHRQLNAIRNRMTTMANEVTEATYDTLPLRHVWVNAEGNYYKLDADSLAPGYTLDSWGGTIGFDVDVSQHITCGLAISAMYGDLKTDAADSATGSVDTMYLSTFLRAAKGSWVHSFVVTCGIAEVDLDRTVNYGAGSYSTNGSTDGYTFGAMYEVGYTGFVNKRGTAALQPVFNAEVRHISLKGYTETGSDAGLSVDDIERTVVTFGAGARAQFAVAANAFNRTSVLETRALLKYDVGDRSGTSSNAIKGDSTYTDVESAEVGAVGIEAGVGISVPLGAAAGSIFADGSFEFRDGQTSANATLGYRITF